MDWVWSELKGLAVCGGYIGLRASSLEDLEACRAFRAIASNTVPAIQGRYLALIGFNQGFGLCRIRVAWAEL